MHSHQGISMLKRIHHTAIICSDYEKSKHFYTEVLGLEIVAENYRETRDSWKLDLGLPDGGQIELFSFPLSPSGRMNLLGNDLRFSMTLIYCHLRFMRHEVAFVLKLQEPSYTSKIDV